MFSKSCLVCELSVALVAMLLNALMDRLYMFLDLELVRGLVIAEVTGVLHPLVHGPHVSQQVLLLGELAVTLVAVEPQTFVFGKFVSLEMTCLRELLSAQVTTVFDALVNGGNVFGERRLLVGLVVTVTAQIL